MMENPQNVAAFLKEQLEKLRQKNERLSLRAMSRKVQMSPGNLSELMSGKRRLSATQAKKIAEGLSLSESERIVLFSMINTHSRRSRTALRTLAGAS